MNRSTFHLLVLFATLHLVAACGGEGSSPRANFHGDWIVVSDAAQKLPCELSALEETQLHELQIDQNGSAVLLDFEGIALNGNIQDELLIATGSGETGETIEIALTLVGGTLLGELRIAGNCIESRAVSARRRGPDADFSGHWELELTVVGEGGCEHIVDYSDCFRIFQSGSDLLVVDDVSGNLSGYVIGNFAHIERDTAEEQTALLFDLDIQDQTMSGEAIRVFSAQACRSDLEFVARRTDIPCALHGS